MYHVEKTVGTAEQKDCMTYMVTNVPPRLSSCQLPAPFIAILQLWARFPLLSCLFGLPMEFPSIFGSTRFFELITVEIKKGWGKNREKEERREKL